MRLSGIAFGDKARLGAERSPTDERQSGSRTGDPRRVGRTRQGRVGPGNSWPRSPILAHSGKDRNEAGSRWRPLPPYDNLDFHLVRATMSGQPVTSIVCEDVVVETIEDAAHQPMNPVPKQPSGTILNIRPQEPPPHTAGMQAGAGTAFQGEAPLTITFADGEAVARWLNGQSQEVAAAFAARAASSRALTIRSESRSAARPPGRAMRPAPRAVSVKASSAPCAMPTIGETSAVGPKVG